MKYYIGLSILIIIILIIIIGFISKNNYKILQENKDYIVKLDIITKQRDDAVKNVKTITVFKTLTDPQKEIAYQNLLSIIDNDSKIQTDLKNQLVKTNESLLKSDKKVLIQGIASIGTGQDLKLKTAEGGLVSGVFLHNHLTFGGGGTINQEFDTTINKTLIGGQIMLTIGVMF